jgi:hypothetical protein
VSLAAFLMKPEPPALSMLKVIADLHRYGRTIFERTLWRASRLRLAVNNSMKAAGTSAVAAT